MAGAKPFGLQTSLIAWNAGLSLFSLIGFLRTAPHLLHTIATDGFYTSVRGLVVRNGSPSLFATTAAAAKVAR